MQRFDDPKTTFDRVVYFMAGRPEQWVYLAINSKDGDYLKDKVQGFVGALRTDNDPPKKPGDDDVQQALAYIARETGFADSRVLGGLKELFNTDSGNPFVAVKKTA